MSLRLCLALHLGRISWHWLVTQVNNIGCLSSLVRHHVGSCWLAGNILYIYILRCKYCSGCIFVQDAHAVQPDTALAGSFPRGVSELQARPVEQRELSFHGWRKRVRAQHSLVRLICHSWCAREICSRWLSNLLRKFGRKIRPGFGHSASLPSRQSNMTRTRTSFAAEAGCWVPEAGDRSRKEMYIIMKYRFIFC